MASRTPVQEDVQVLINRSLFSRTDADGTLEENMIDYLRIYEQDPGGGASKTRWLMLAVTKYGKCVLHKAKQNSNLSFSKGKTWALEDMRTMEQFGPTAFALTMTTRTYTWKTDNARDLTDFLNNLYKTYRNYKHEEPRLVNFTPDTLPPVQPPQMPQQQAQAPPRSPANKAAPLRNPALHNTHSVQSVHSRYSDMSSAPFAQMAPPVTERSIHRNTNQSDLVPPLTPYTPMHMSPNSPATGNSAVPGHFPNRSPRAPPPPSLPGQYPAQSGGAHLIPPRGGPGMASTTSLSSSHHSNNSAADLGTPSRPKRSSFSSDASMNRSVGSQEGFERKPMVTSSREHIGLGVAPPQRRGSGDDRRGAPPVSGQRYDNSGPGYRRPSAGSAEVPAGFRRPSAGAPEIPPLSRRRPSVSSADAPPPLSLRRPSAGSIDTPPVGYRRPSASEIPPVDRMSVADDDPYGGMTEETLRSPPIDRSSEVLIPPVVHEPPPMVKTSSKGSSHRAPSRQASNDRSAAPLSDSTTKASDRSAPKLEVDTLAPSRPRERTRTPDPASLQRRVSFHPPPLTTAYSRDVLLTSKAGAFGAIGEDDPEEAGDAIMANVEEMIEGFDWTAVTAPGPDRGKGTDVIEGRLLDELAALESANIHAFLESDDRIDQVLVHIDDALLELDELDAQLAGYRMQLSVVSEDIEYIEGQNRGLQVQTSNQHALLNEIRQLLQITDVPREDLSKLSQVSPASKRGVQELEHAAASLYKAIQASRDSANEVAATSMNFREYRDTVSQFSTRILEYLDISFKHQSDTTLAEYKKNNRQPKLAPHTTLGENLMSYEGLVLFVKDMDDERYKKLCLNYITTMSKLHQAEMSELLMSLIKKLSATTQSSDVSFAKATIAPPKLGAVGRSKTLRRPSGMPSNKTGDEATLKVAEFYNQAITEVVGQIVTEDDFINAFLHLADNESTFADYMQLDTYFRRQAARHASRNNPSLVQIARSVMDLMFGFVDGEFKNWVDAAMQRDPSAVVGVIAVTERLAEQAAEEGTSLFLTQLFEKQLGRQRQAFDSFIKEQIRTVDGAKNTIKRRRGVFYFIRHFHAFVERIECQLQDAENLGIRKRVDGAYEKVVVSVLGSLQHVSKIVGAETSSGEDKGQLYFHVVMIENLHVFVEDVSHLEVPALAVYLQRARGLYEENMKAYLKMMMRRGFARLMDFMDGVERLLRTTPATEVALHQNYSKSALKKILKDSGAKDMRKAVEAMARRVDKHFTHDDDGGAVGAVGAVVGVGQSTAASASDPATQALISSVWRELCNELKRETARASDYISKCYDNNLSLEYTARDIESYCQRVKH